MKGRYRGSRVSPPLPNGQTDILEFRVEEHLVAGAPSIVALSGDRDFEFPYSEGGVWKRRRDVSQSWVVPFPSSAKVGGLTVASGRGLVPETMIPRVDVAASWAPSGDVEVRVAELSGGLPRRYNCRRVGDELRELRLKIDVCRSLPANAIPLPCDVLACGDAPPNLPADTLSLESAFERAGISLQTKVSAGAFDDLAEPDFPWSPESLHAVMTSSVFPSSGGNAAAWPRWDAWAFVAGRCSVEAAAGVMFDGGSLTSIPPARQGLAIFRRSPLFRGLDAGAAPLPEAIREYLFTWVHEIGHVLNLPHVFEPGHLGPDTVTWMNYPTQFAAGPGGGGFWGHFRYEFDPKELWHLHHGSFRVVAPGGVDLHGSPLMAPVPQPPASSGRPQVELTVRSAGCFDFLEPVWIEVRVRNRSRSLEVEVPANLSPERGTAQYWIRRAGGAWRQFDPPIRFRMAEAPATLLPGGRHARGGDRKSRRIALGCDRSGFVFSEPGQYEVVVVMALPSGGLVSSEPQPVRVLMPASKEEERLGHRLHGDGVASAMWLRGSGHDRLRKAMDLIREAAERLPGVGLGRDSSVLLGDFLGRSAYGSDKSGRALRTRDGDPELALRMTEEAWRGLLKDTDRSANLPLGALAVRRARHWRALGERARATGVIRTAATRLVARGVKPAAIEEIRRAAGR